MDLVSEESIVKKEPIAEEELVPRGIGRAGEKPIVEVLPIAEEELIGDSRVRTDDWSNRIR